MQENSERQQADREEWVGLTALPQNMVVCFQGATDVALTAIDVLGYLDTIPVCVGYEIDGKITKSFPVTPMLEKAKPVLEYLPG